MPASFNWEDSRRATIERHIAEGSSRVERFRVLIHDTALRGGDTRHAQRLLATMEASLTTLRKIRADNCYRQLDVERQPLHFHAPMRQDPPRPTRSPVAAEHIPA